MLPRILVFINNEWVVKAEGARAQSLIDSLTSDSALITEPADTRAVMRSTKAHGQYGEIVGLFSGAHNAEKNGLLSTELSVVLARIITSDQSGTTEEPSPAQ